MNRLPSFVGPSYQSQSPIADAERCVNFYPEQIEGQQKIVLYPTPGVSAFSSLATSPVRGMFTQGDRVFTVADAVIYELFSDGTNIARASGLTNDGTPVTISSNGDGGGELFITSGGKGFIYDLAGNTLTQVLNPSHFGGYVDGYFISLNITNARFEISDLFDGTTWGASAYSQRTAAPDPWKALIANKRDLWLFGTHTSEVWYNAGQNATTPFAPISGALTHFGIAAPYSVALLSGGPVWLSQSEAGAGIVVRANGYQAERISTHALEFALSRYSTIADAVGWVYQDQGHSFYILSFETAGATWVYDAATGMWHERGSWNTTSMQFDEWRVRWHTYAFGAHLVGDRAAGGIYRLSVQAATEVDGTGIRRMRRTPHVSNVGTRVFFRTLQAELETGVGLNSGQGSAPALMLKWSDDYGRTWGNEHWVTAGAIGAYRTRAVWRRLGWSRARVYELTVSDPVPWRLVDAFVEVEGSAH